MDLGADMVGDKTDDALAVGGRGPPLAGVFQPALEAVKPKPPSRRTIWGTRRPGSDEQIVSPRAVREC